VAAWTLLLAGEEDKVKGRRHSLEPVAKLLYLAGGSVGRGRIQNRRNHHERPPSPSGTSCRQPGSTRASAWRRWAAPAKDSEWSRVGEIGEALSDSLTRQSFLHQPLHRGRS